MAGDAGISCESRRGLAPSAPRPRPSEPRRGGIYLGREHMPGHGAESSEPRIHHSLVALNPAWRAAF